MEKKFYRIFWRNGEVDFVIADNLEALFQLLDREADPFGATIEEVDLSKMPALKFEVKQETHPFGRVKTYDEEDWKGFLDLPVKKRLTTGDLNRIFRKIVKRSAPVEIRL